MGDGNSFNRKKIRGARRNYNRFIDRLVYYTSEFPNLLDASYWHFHMPCSNLLLNSPKSPSYVKTGCVNTIINRTKHLMSIKPQQMEDTKVVAVIDIHNLWDSQIVIFNDEKYYNDFFNRNDEYQKWILLKKESVKTFISKWNIAADINVQGYEEIIIDEDFKHKREIWCVGELKLQ